MTAKPRARANASAICLLVGSLLGCTQPVFHSVPLAELSPETHERVLVLLTDGSTVDLEDPILRNDTLRGQQGAKYVRIPRSAIVQVQAPVRRFSPGKTIGLLVLGGLVGLVYVFVRLSGAGST